MEMFIHKRSRLLRLSIHCPYHSLLQISFTEAVRKNLLDRETGAYHHNVNNEDIYVGDAIRRGFIKATIVQDPSSLDIDPENKMVVEKVNKLLCFIVKRGYKSLWMTVVCKKSFLHLSCISGNQKTDIFWSLLEEDMTTLYKCPHFSIGLIGFFF